MAWINVVFIQAGLTSFIPFWINYVDPFYHVLQIALPIRCSQIASFKRTKLISSKLDKFISF